MSERWRKVREVLLRARGVEPMDGLPEEAIRACIGRGWLEEHHWVQMGRWAVVLTESGWDAAGYMSDAEAFEEAFNTWRTDGGVVRKPALPEDVPWPVLRERLARERGWT